MKKSLFIVPQIGFNEIELFAIKKILEKSKIKCTIASFSKGRVIGKHEKIANATEIIKKINYADYDCFIFVGGENASSLSEYQCVLDLLKNANKLNKLIALLCMHPAIFLPSLPFLKNKKMTVFKSKNNWSVGIIKKEAVYVDESVVIDGNILTCRGEEDAKQLAEKIVKLLNK